jgi:hypothetical protein
MKKTLPRAHRVYRSTCDEFQGKEPEIVAWRKTGGEEMVQVLCRIYLFM